MTMELEKLKKMHDKAYEHGQDTREQASNDMVFYYVTQWDDTLLEATPLAYRGQFDIVRKAGRQVIAQLNANPVQVDFEPKADSRDDGAEFLDGLYRSDDRVNTTIESYRMAEQEAVVCGFGAWMLYTEYQNNSIGDNIQVIRRKPLYEAVNKVFWDPNAKLLDKADAKFVSILHSYSEDGYRDFVSELTGQDRDDVVISNAAVPDSSFVFPWLSQNATYYICEMFVREKVKTKIYYIESPVTGMMIVRESDVEDILDEMVDGGYELVSEKEIDDWEVKRYLFSGFEILDESVIASSQIPVVPMYGERGFVEEEEYYEGITRLAKDPQRLRNFQMSYLADIVSRSPRPKPIFYPEQIQGFEFMYNENGADSNYPYLLQNPMTVNGEPLPLGPAGQMPEQKIPDALIASLQLSREAVEDVANPGLPQDLADPDLSGKAIYALQNRLDHQTMVYQDNKKHAKRRDAVIYASMASRIYDSPRAVTLTLPDGQRKKAQVMESIVDRETGDQIVINDLTNTEFDVFADIGPSYTSQKDQNRQDIANLLSSLTPGTPEHQMLMYKYLSMVDGTEMEDMRKYVNKQMILAGFKEPETDEDKQILIQAQQAQGEQGAQEQLALMEGQARMMEGQAALQNEVNDARKLEIDWYKAQTDRGKVEVTAAEAGVKMQNTRADTEGKRLDNLFKVSER